jgi:hypothetical protein
LCTHICLLYSSVLFGISSTAAQYQAMWRITSVDSTTSRHLSPSRRPCGTLLFMYLFYASAFLEPILDSVVIKNSFTIYTLLFRDMCCDILIILLHICVTWSWRIYDCSVYVFINRVWHRLSAVPTKHHWTGVKTIFRYLQGTTDLDLFYQFDQDKTIIGYKHAGYLSDPQDARSQTGFVFLHDRMAISWKSSKQTLVATSTNHSEIIILYEASCECVWLRRMINHIQQ